MKKDPLQLLKFFLKHRLPVKLINEKKALFSNISILVQLREIMNLS